MNKLKSLYAQFVVLLGAVMTATPSFAINKTDLTTDTSGGKTFDDVATNVDNAAQSGASLIIQLVTIGGFIIVAISVYSLYKASKDDSGREKPMAAIAGCVLGGLMASIAGFMWVMKNTVMGT